MNKKITTLAFISTLVTIFGFLLDGDAKEPSMAMRFIEFFAMAGIVFTLFSVLYFSSAFVIGKMRTAKA